MGSMAAKTSAMARTEPFLMAAAGCPLDLRAFYLQNLVLGSSWLLCPGVSVLQGVRHSCKYLFSETLTRPAWLTSDLQVALPPGDQPGAMGRPMWPWVPRPLCCC